MLKRSLHIVWLLTVACLLVVAIALTAARLWVPSLADYRHDIELAASEVLGREVTVGRIQATWRGLHPVLKLRNVVIRLPDSAEGSFTVDEIWLRLDIGHYLRHREVSLAGIDIIGVDLELVRDESGHLFVKQFGNVGPGTGNGDDGGLDFLANIGRVSLHESALTFTDLQAGHAPRRFSSVMLAVTNNGDQHRLTGHAWLPGDIGYRLEMDALLTGSDPDVQTWRGRAYIKGQQLSLPSLLQYWQPALVARGNVDLRLWVDVEAGHIGNVSSELNLRDLYVERAAADRQYVFSADALGLRLGWQRADGDWQAVLQLLSAEQGGRQWAPFSFSVTGGPAGETQHLRVSSRQLVLNDLWHLLPAVPGLDTAQFDELAALRPTGQLDELEVRLLRGADGVQFDGISARFSELGIAETRTTPYVAGLDGVISGSAQGGTLTIDSREVDIADSRLFRDILAVNGIQGDFQWRRDADALRISSEQFSLVNPQMSLLGDFTLLLPANSDSPYLDLKIAVESADVGGVSQYLPAKVMSVNGVDWLDHSLVSGQVRNGTIRILGPLDQLPFDNGEGELEVRLPVFNVTLDFNDAWTPITGLDAQVDFTGRSMDITSERGRIRSADLQQVRAHIRDLAYPSLTIDGGVRGPLPVMLAELGSSPLGERFGGFVDRAIATGSCSLQLDLDIPLSSAQREVSAAGRISLRDNTLKIRDTDIALSDIRGVLTFDEDGIQGDGLKAILFGRPADARVWGEPGKPDTYIRFTGKLGLVDALLETNDPLRKAVTGESDWQIQLIVRGTPARGEAASVGVQVTSSLAGTAIDLPAPLGKDARTVRPLSIEIDNVNRSQQRVTLAYGEDIRGKLLLESRQNTTRLQRGMLSLGGDAATLPDTPELLIKGRLDMLRLSDWQPWLNEGQADAAIPLHLDLGIGELEGMGYTVNDLQLATTSAGRSWTILVSGESSQGEIELTRSGQGVEKIVMNMQRLAVKKSPDAPPVADQRMTPADMPELQISAAELVFNDVNFGQFDLKAAALADNQYRIERLALSSDLLSMRLEGTWHMTGRNHQSRVEAEVTNGRMGDLLNALGYEKSIKDGTLNGSMRMAWAAPLTEFSPEILDGKLNIIIKNGQLLDIEPGAGRALGLLSLGKLPRRLRLDFSDLVEEGFNFERIAGTFVLDQGNAYTNDLVVDGPAAKIDISGRVGLTGRDYDQLVTVTPYLDASLPLAGAIIGGPAVGAAALVAEKLLAGRLGLNEMARKQYTLLGSWDAPEVAPIETDVDTDENDFDIYDE
jgi:uncharacterized protein (TIGR02099 family)